MTSSTIRLDAFVANEPKLGRLPNGTPVLDLRLPHTPRRLNELTKQWENVGETTWHSVSLFGDEAELYAPHVRKGTRVVVTGTPELRLWSKEGRHGGEIVVKSASIALKLRPKANPAAPQPDDAWATPNGGQDETPW